MDIEAIVQYGKEYAQNSPLKFKHCALIVKGEGSSRRIVAKGHNSYIMDLLNHNHSIHSEVAVLEDFINNNTSPRLPRHKRIAQAKAYMKKNSYDMVVIRIGQNNYNKTRNSKPCTKCQKHLTEWSFRQIYYTT
jgi:hypothetical protein